MAHIDPRLPLGGLSRVFDIDPLEIFGRLDPLVSSIRGSLVATEAGVEYRLALPGIPREALDISIVNGHDLRVAVDHEGRQSETLVTLPDKIDLENSSSTYRDGLLTVKFPHAEPQVRRIAIEVGDGNDGSRQLSQEAGAQGEVTADGQSATPDEVAAQDEVVATPEGVAVKE